MATYRITASTDDLMAVRVTETLGLMPSQSVEVGQKVAPSAPAAMLSQWWLSSGPGPVDGNELSAQIALVLDRLHPRRDLLWRLAEAGYRMDWFCYIGSHPTGHAVELSRELMRRLLDLPGALLLDIYDDYDEAEPH